MTLYILKNQRAQYLNRQLEWTADCPADQLFFSQHRDVVINQLIELNSQDIYLRAEIVSCEANARDIPVIRHATTQQPASRETEQA